MVNYSENDSLEILLNQYNEQMDLVKEKLLNGVNWDHLAEDRIKITKMAATICQSLVEKQAILDHDQ
jgi:hypothetical protein